MIGVKKEEGHYYWTITTDGVTEFLTDNTGHRLPVTDEKGDTGDTGKPGTDGQPGTTPTLSINATGNWAVNEKEILVNGHPIPATGPEGDQGPDGQPGAGGNGAESSTYFKSADLSQPDYVTFVLKYDSQFSLPICHEITFDLTDADFSYRMRARETHTLSYTGTGIHAVTVKISDGWRATSDTVQHQIILTAPSDQNLSAVHESTLSVMASNHQGQQIVITRKIHLILKSYRIDLTHCNAAQSDVYRILSPENTPVAEICYEYVKGYTETARQRSLMVYPWNPVKEEYSTGYVVDNGGCVNRDGTDYIAGNESPVTSVSIDIAGQFAPDAEAISTLLPIPDQITDFDANSYGIVKSGNQYWMKENFRNTSLRKPDGSPETLKHPEEYDAYEPGSETTCGWLYDYKAIFDNKPESWRFLPEGWHLPTSKEISELTAFIPDAQDFRAISNYWTSWSGHPNTDISGFGALPGGYVNRNLPGHPHAGLHTSAEYWTRSKLNGVKNPVLKIDYNTNHCTIILSNNYAEQRSIRCIRDNRKK